MLSSDGWVTRAATAPSWSAPKACCPEGGARCHWRNLHLYLHYPFASTCGFFLDKTIQVQMYTYTYMDSLKQICTTYHLSFSRLLLLLPSLPKTAASGKPGIRSHAPPVPRVPSAGPKSSPNGSRQHTSQQNRTPALVPRWLWNQRD